MAPVTKFKTDPVMDHAVPQASRPAAPKGMNIKEPPKLLEPTVQPFSRHADAFQVITNRVLDILSSYGRMSLPALHSESGLPEDELFSALERLLHSGSIRGGEEVEGIRYYRAT